MSRGHEPHDAARGGTRVARACALVLGATLGPLLACHGSSAPGATGTASCDSPAVALLAASDYSSSELVVLRAQGEVGAPFTGVDLGGDPVLSVTNGRCFLVARDHDLLVELDPTCGTPLRELRMGTSSVSGNPQDVAATKDGSLFVPKFRTGDLVVRRPSGELSSLSLSRFDPDGNPQPSSATTVLVGGVEKIVVTLERLDDATLLPGPLPSMLVRVDAATLAIDAELTLVGKDPFGLAVSHGGALFFAEPGLFADATETGAGVERVDPVTMTSALLVREADLGGSVAEVAVTDGCAAAIVAGPTSVNPTSLVTFDPVTGKIHVSAARSPLATPGYDLEGLAFIDGALWVGDRRRAAGGYPLHTFAVDAACGLTAQPDVMFSPQKPVSLRSPR